MGFKVLTQKLSANRNRTQGWLIIGIYTPLFDTCTPTPHLFCCMPRPTDAWAFFLEILEKKVEICKSNNRPFATIRSSCGVMTIYLTATAANSDWLPDCDGLLQWLYLPDCDDCSGLHDCSGYLPDCDNCSGLHDCKWLSIPDYTWLFWLYLAGYLIILTTWLPDWLLGLPG